MDKVECLRKIIEKLTGSPAPEELDTVCKCLDRLAEIVSADGGSTGNPINSAVLNLSAKTTSEGKFLTGYSGGISGQITLADGSNIPITINITDE